jgi:hypothetical protein
MKQGTVFNVRQDMIMHILLVCCKMSCFQVQTADEKNLMHWATDWVIGVVGFDSGRGLKIFLSTTASKSALGPTQPPIQWVPAAFSLGVKRPGREADHSPPSNTEVINAWSYISTPPIRLHGVVPS